MYVFIEIKRMTNKELTKNDIFSTFLGKRKNIAKTVQFPVSHLKHCMSLVRLADHSVTN